jgi:hexosaminidase
MTPSGVLLFPTPRVVSWSGRHWSLPSRLALTHGSAAGAEPALEWLAMALRARGHELARGPGSEGPAQLRLDVLSDGSSSRGGVGSEQGYRLAIVDGSIRITAAQPAGIQYALATLVQCVLQAPGTDGHVVLPEGEIEDYPDFPVRGVMLDVSRDKVPTVETLRMLIDRLTRWKVNQLQLYMEHTFAYVGHEAVWKDASPLTPEEIRELDEYAAARHLELVPNQNSFGHMHRWLAHEPYRALAECPNGFDHAWSSTREPYGLCPIDPRSLELLENLYDQLLPNFGSRQFNVGLDETFDLGSGRSQQACRERGTSSVYLEFLKQVHARVKARGCSMQFWSDIIQKHPEVIGELPKDATLLEWGYEAEHPFAENLARLRAAGLPFYVCPGTSSWNSLAGRTHNAVLNLAAAAREGRAAGASGLLVTDWGDNGHLQPLPISYLGLLLGAGFSWNVSAAERPLDLDVPTLLDAFAFEDRAATLGRVAYDLGNAYRHAGSLRTNASVLFWILIKPERQFTPPGVTRETLERTLDYVERVSAPLTYARPATPDGPLVIAEMEWARDMLSFACRLGLAREGSLRSKAQSSTQVTRVLADELDALIVRHRAQWRARNRAGGLDDSARRLERVRDALRAGKFE